MSNPDLERILEMHDETLKELRESWIKAKRVDDDFFAKEAMKRIDRALDFRLKIMRAIDAEKSRK